MSKTGKPGSSEVSTLASAELEAPGLIHVIGKRISMFEHTFVSAVCGNDMKTKGCHLDWGINWRPHLYAGKVTT